MNCSLLTCSKSFMPYSIQFINNYKFLLWPLPGPAFLLFFLSPTIKGTSNFKYHIFFNFAIFFTLFLDFNFQVFIHLSCTNHVLEWDHFGRTQVFQLMNLNPIFWLNLSWWCQAYDLAVPLSPPPRPRPTHTTCWSPLTVWLSGPAGAS